VPTKLASRGVEAHQPQICPSKAITTIFTALFVFFYIYIKHATERLIINLHLFQGYVVVQSFFTKEELQPVIESINEIVDDVAEKLYKAGKISSMAKYRLNDDQNLIP